jgi:hypothetical protein
VVVVLVVLVVVVEVAVVPVPLPELAEVLRRGGNRRRLGDA